MKLIFGNERIRVFFPCIIDANFWIICVLGLVKGIIQIFIFDVVEDILLFLLGYSC